MTTLFIDTATPLCAIALEHQGTLEVRILDDDRQHVEVLAAGVEQLLHEHGLSMADVQRVAVDRGPGLYTGLRVGVATAVALSDAVGAELVGVTSLELLAHGAHAQGHRGNLAAIVDGRRGEVFFQAFELSEVVTARGEAMVRTPNDVVVEYGTSGAPTMFVGDGAVKYREFFGLMPWISVPDLGTAWIAAGPTVAALYEPGPVELLYMREPDAVANFTTRQ